MDKGEIDRLFFELANTSRLDILRALQTENLKMQEIGRRLDLTATEAFRQLERLSAASLVQRQTDGSYALTQYGKLQLHFASIMEFALKNKQYFLNHNIWRLPPQFVSRIGEISMATLKMNLVESLGRAPQMIWGAQRFMWGMSIEPIPQPFDEIAKQIPKSVEYRFLSPQPPARLPNLENRTLVDGPAILVLSEKEAFVCFRFADGRVDYASFSGNDVAFTTWVKDLFLYYWDRGKKS